MAADRRAGGKIGEVELQPSFSHFIECPTARRYFPIFRSTNLFEMYLLRGGSFRFLISLIALLLLTPQTDTPLDVHFRTAKPYLHYILLLNLCNITYPQMDLH